MSDPLRHFLIVYDHDQGKLISVEEFDSSDPAVQAYAAKEKEIPEDGTSRIEIVLIGSDSLDTVRLTHANYFDGSVPHSKYLVGI